MANLMGETKVEAPISKYWNSKKTPAAKGDQVKGVVLRAEADEYKGKPTTRYVLQGEDGNEVVLPNHTVLNNTMKKVQVGKTVRIVYQGKGEAARGRSAPELYDVYIVNVPSSAPEATTQAPIADPSGKILEKLKPAGKHGLPDDGFWSMAAAECGGAGVAVRVVEKLKAEGKVLNQNGFWTAT